MPGGLKRRVVDALPEPALRRIGRALHREPVALDRPATRVAAPGALTVTAFDAHELARTGADTVLAALEAAGVEAVRVPGRHGRARQLAVAAGDRVRALAALDRLVTEPGWTLAPRRRTGAPVVRLGRALVSPAGRPVPAGDVVVEVGFWRAGPDGARLAPSDNQVTEAIGAGAWAAALAAPDRWPADAAGPDVFELREPVDLVYTWVDGDDPAWQARRAAHDPAHDAGHNASAVHAARFLSRDELRYSLRSVAMYASWVRRIHVVTDAQLPPWLDTAHPKINVVDHGALFADPSVLPVFNSHAIESQLHRIEGLAEHYVYLNDDMFFGRAVDPELFFQANGIAHFFLGKGTVDLDPASPADLPVVSAAKNQRELLRRDFGVQARRKFKHVGHPQHRSLVEELERAYPEMFARVAASRFRHPDDLSVPSSLVHYWSYERGRAVPGEIHYRYQDIGLPDTARRLDEIRRERPQMFCLNDITSDPAQWDEQARTLQEFFDECYPLPSPYER